MTWIRSVLAGGSLLVFLLCSAVLPAEEEVRALNAARSKEIGASPEAVFEMKEVPLLEKETEQGQSLALSSEDRASCSPEPAKEVKAYPKLKSKRPLYGSITFGRSPVEPTAGVKFHFVLDESGEGPEDKKAPKKTSQALLDALAASVVGRPKPSARYDRLYFDLNRDRDLTNDPVVLPVAKQPPHLPEYGEEARVFDCLEVEFDYGPGLGRRPFRILPQLNVDPDGDATLAFLPSVARQGKVLLGKQEFQASLTQSYSISGRFDRPFTTLRLEPVTGSGHGGSLGDTEWLCELREVEGKLYRFSASPMGDKLTVSRSQGAFGLLKVGPASRKIEGLGIRGVVVSKDLALQLGGRSSPGALDCPDRHRLPVGDYLPWDMSVNYGRVMVDIAPVTDVFDGSGGLPARRAIYGFHIREDKPYVLDFSNKPLVEFVHPQPTETLRPGESLRIEAILTDPVLGLRITNLEDRTQKVGERRLRDGEGHEIVVPRFAPLNPRIIIKDPDGRTIAEGEMPFG